MYQSIREAIRRLEMMQLVQHIPYEGVRVTALSMQNMIELYHVREMMEGKAATHISETALKELAQLLCLHRRHQQSTGEYIQADSDCDFHYKIIMSSGNTMLIQQLTEKLYHLIHMYRKQFCLTSSYSELALREHEHIFYAIQARDSTLAEVTIRRHIVRARKAIEQRLRLHYSKDTP